MPEFVLLLPCSRLEARHCARFPFILRRHFYERSLSTNRGQQAVSELIMQMITSHENADEQVTHQGEMREL